MYKEYFIAAKDYLQRQGMNPVLQQRRVVSEPDIWLIDQRTDQPMPPELRRFYVEMGDAFQFIPDDTSDSPLYGWEPAYLNDYLIHNIGFHTALEEDVSHTTDNSHPLGHLTILRDEAEKRKKWIHFYGFTGGGNTLCLDVEGKVRFYQALEWAAQPDLYSFVLANSFMDFIEKWSAYAFIVPGSRCGWTSFCWNRSGVFDWSPSYFPYKVDR